MSNYPQNSERLYEPSDRLSSVLRFTDQGLVFEIKLIGEPSEGQFANAGAEAQAIALISCTSLTYQSFNFAVCVLSKCSRNFRRQLFAARTVLNSSGWPSFRIADGTQRDIEAALWDWLKDAQQHTKAEAIAKAKDRKIAIRNSVTSATRRFNGYTALSLGDSEREAKQTLSQSKVLAKKALGNILSEIMDGQLELSNNLLDYTKELLKGSNLATCSPKLRTKIVEALNRSGNWACLKLAEIIAGAYDPFIAKAQVYDLDSLDLKSESIKTPEAVTVPKTKLSLAEKIAAKRAALKGN